MNKKTKVLVGFLCITFAVGIVFSPSIFAQATQKFDFQKQKDIAKYQSLINEVFNYVIKYYVDDVDPEVLYKGAMQGLLSSLDDPYTSYLDTSQQRNIDDTTMGQFGGVGLTITKEEFITVSSPVEGSPGWKAGIVAGDEIIKIDEQSTKELTLDEAVSLLRGTIGTTVDVVVRRDKTMEFNATLSRALIEVPTVRYGFIKEAPQKTAYLKIIEFTPLTASRVQEALDYFVEQKLTSLIIDLRNNPGGLITAVTDVADKFIDDGVIVSTKLKWPYIGDSYSASPAKTTFTKNIPIVVLIDSGSASASEILAGALKDTKKAYLVGENTYGKGSVQQPMDLPYNDGFKVTIARYYSPSDSNIDKIGIPPDEEVLFPELTPKEQEAYVDLMNSKKINEFVEHNKDCTEAKIAQFANELAKDYPLDTRVLRRIIRLNVTFIGESPLYDYDYDIQLLRAVELTQQPDFFKLLENTKTLKELETERLANEALKKAENSD